MAADLRHQLLVPRPRVSRDVSGDVSGHRDALRVLDEPPRGQPAAASAARAASGETPASPQVGLTATSASGLRRQPDPTPERAHRRHRTAWVRRSRPTPRNRRWARSRRSARRPPRAPRRARSTGWARVTSSERNRAPDRASSATGGLRGAAVGAGRRTGRRRRRRRPRPAAASRTRPAAGRAAAPTPRPSAPDPSSTAGSPGSSHCRSSSAPGTRRRTSAMCAATPSASERARSRIAPGSASAFSPERSSTVAARVHRPAHLQLQRPRVAREPLLQQVEVVGQVGAGPAQVQARRLRPRPTRWSGAQAAGRPAGPPRARSARRRGPGSATPAGAAGPAARRRTTARASPGSVPGMEPHPVAAALGPDPCAAVMRARLVGACRVGGPGGARRSSPTRPPGSPSYSTTAWPGATPVIGSPRRHLDPLAGHLGAGRARLAVRAHLGQAVEAAPLGTGPHQRGRSPRMRSTASASRGPTTTRFGGRFDRQHEAGAAVGGGPVEVQAASLADGVRPGALVPADLGAVGVDDRRRPPSRASGPGSPRCRRRG